MQYLKRLRARQNTSNRELKNNNLQRKKRLNKRITVQKKKILRKLIRRLKPIPLRKKRLKKNLTPKRRIPKRNLLHPLKRALYWETNSSEKHIYDTAQIKDVFNGTRDKKIGEYSIIECLSTDVDESVLADWYYNYIHK